VFTNAQGVNFRSHEDAVFIKTHYCLDDNWDNVVCFPMQQY